MQNEDSKFSKIIVSLAVRRVVVGDREAAYGV